MRMQIGDRLATVMAGPGSVRLDGVEHEVSWDGQRLRLGRRVFRVRGNRQEFWLDGRRYLAREVTSSARAVTPTTFDGQVRAAMPGSILQLKVEVGAQVEAGQPLLVMESMKMEMSLEAPGDGIVRELNCQVGDLVAVGALLVRLDVSRD